jgi:hypothetical protein
MSQAEKYGRAIRFGWCTRDWCGGSSYSTNGFRDMVRTVWNSRDMDPTDRQAPQWCATFDTSGDHPWRDSYVLIVDFKMVDLSLQAWPGWRGGTDDRPKIRYLHLNPRYWRWSNWFKDKR